MKLKILSWNVRGANDSDKRKVIKNLIRTNKVDLVCLQETKVQEMNFDMVRSLGVGRFLDWTAMNAEGSAGGILMFWDKRRMSRLETMVGSYSVSCLFKMVDDGFLWAFTGVYGPVEKYYKETFWEELGSNWARLKVYGKNLGVWEVTSTQFSILEKELLGAGLTIQ